jgi:hypothetical protein
MNIEDRELKTIPLDRELKNKKKVVIKNRM